MQELAETGARLAAPPVPAAGLVLGHQARGLQGLLDERIAEAHAMLAPGELVEMPDVEPQIPLAIEREQALHLGDRGALGRGGLPPAVQEPVIPVMLQPPADAPDRAGAVAQDVGGLHPGQLPVDGPQDHFLYFHGTLHSAARVGHGLLLGGHSCHAARSERSTHVSILGGQLTYPQHILRKRLTARAVRSNDSESCNLWLERGRAMRFRDKVALITAAGSGIGWATAEIIGAEGGAVVGVDTDKARLDALVDTSRRGGGQAEARRADGLDPAQVTEAVDGVARAHGRIDILVNAVGGSTIIARPAATVDELTLAEWQRLIAFNLDATFLFCHAVAPVMKRQRSGKIVNISSIAGRGISPTSSSAYAAAKGGIIAFTRKLAHELGPFGVAVNAIAPSLTLTERIRPHWDRRTPEQQAAEIARTPLRRVAEAVDQARVICFLASCDADFVTGVTIDVTGGV